MPQDVHQLKTELDDVYHKADQYFQNAHKLMQESVKGLSEGEAYRIDREYWSRMTEGDRQLGVEIANDLIEVMSKLAVAVRQSPLLDDADQREIVTYTKTMRAALYFRKYIYRAPEAIHDEGTVFGVSPAEQTEVDMGITRAQRLFRQTYEATLKILELIGSGATQTVSSPLKSNLNLPKYRPNTAFIMMWMDPDHPELDDTRDAIRSSFEAFGIQALRSDDIEHEDMITKRILDEIATSEFLIADLTGSRPSVYYEVGFAHALGKRVILCRKKGTALHFDLAVHNCPEYENLRELKGMLNKRLQALTNRSPISSAI